jgi:methylated-DNA-[protein]-cysteine S-methyltransferase
MTVLSGGTRFAAVRAPWGSIHVAVARDAVVALELLTPSEAFRDSLERRFGPVGSSDRAAKGLLDRAVDQIEAYLRGERHAFDLPIDLSRRPAWDRAVLDAVRSVGWGTTTSYGRVARMIGRTGAARAAGAAVGRNPVGLIVPCHRVIAGDGSIGGYGGDWYGSREQLLAIKRELLAREGITLPVRFGD